MNDIPNSTNGRLYSSTDMVKIGCRDCEGCSSCCHDMGQSIILDPFDIYNLQKNLGISFQVLMTGPVELHVEEGIIVPNLKMAEGTTSCSYLNEEGRCSIHSFRPGICRLFPLGRNYDENGLGYFIVEGGCPAENKTKVKINKWLEIKNLPKYEKFLVTWHDYLKKLRARVAAEGLDNDTFQAVNMKYLTLFYMTPYETDDFFAEFEARMANAPM